MSRRNLTSGFRGLKEGYRAIITRKRMASEAGLSSSGQLQGRHLVWEEAGNKVSWEGQLATKLTV